ncbi:4a-hydroxytetrahydrobiopterin dehydratase [Aquirufa sp.]|jgi:4a-hydroxytetrahydrobiopterin dehydratase|uniref:4a-hydroxytetrahydrobiopterin dehydratase n=1 Tax=Aquirufa sp. TaxID=2676249 RepID=UPI0037BE5348
MNNWLPRENCLEKTYTFANFEAAMLFMQQAAIKISELDHHPTWTNTYNRIHVLLQTHDAGNSVTEKDRELAQILDTLFLSV